MLSAAKDYIKRTRLADPFIFAKSLVKSPTSQADEAVILGHLVQRYQPPKLFVEFGFSGWEFNCAPLVRDWDGLLIDTNPYNVRIGSLILPSRVTCRHQWIDLTNIDLIIDYVEGRPLGVLSIDVDGNDYWFLERLLKLDPVIIIAEYNSSFGLRQITVPYDDTFDRMKKHSSRLYYGASLKALNNLANSYGYSLMAVTDSGINAFFVKSAFLTRDDAVLNVEHSFKEKKFPDGSRHFEQWDKIKHLDFVEIS